MSPSELTRALLPVVQSFDALGIGYFVGGSVASSAHGLPRTTLDVDVVAEMEPADVEPFVARLRGLFYVDAGMIRKAILHEGSFNVVHLETMLKVDVFVRKSAPYDRTAFVRAQQGRLDPSTDAIQVRLSTAEDVILHKLYWYQLGGEVSERQWNDVIGVLRVQSEALDLGYMQQWAAELGTTPLLERALREAELR